CQALTLLDKRFKVSGSHVPIATYVPPEILATEHHSVVSRWLKHQLVGIVAEINFGSQLRRSFAPVVQESIRPAVFADVALEIFLQKLLDELEEADEVRLSRSIRPDENVEILKFQVAFLYRLVALQLD